MRPVNGSRTGTHRGYFSEVKPVVPLTEVPEIAASRLVDVYDLASVLLRLAFDTSLDGQAR